MELDRQAFDLGVSLEEALGPQLSGIRYPCVVKPLALSGSRGVIRADSDGEHVRRWNSGSDCGPGRSNERVLGEQL